MAFYYPGDVHGDPPCACHGQDGPYYEFENQTSFISFAASSNHDTNLPLEGLVNKLFWLTNAKFLQTLVNNFTRFEGCANDPACDI